MLTNGPRGLVARLQLHKGCYVTWTAKLSLTGKIKMPTAHREDRWGKREIGEIWVPSLGVWGETMREGRRWREERSQVGES